MVEGQSVEGGRAVFEFLEAAPPLRQRVYQALEESIVDGIFPPGWHLREDDLAKRLGVSRNPVREALQGLVHDGLADHQPGKGVFVHAPSLNEVEEVFHARALLESDSARLAAERISPTELRELEEILELGKVAALGRDASQLLVLNERFHNVIIVAANNSIMAKMMIPLQRRIRWYFSSVVVMRAAGSWDQHAEILGAIRDGDGEKAANYMAAHVMHTAKTIMANQETATADGPGTEG